MNTRPLLSTPPPITMICSKCGRDGEVNTDKTEKKTYCFNCREMTLFKFPKTIPLNLSILYKEFEGFC